MPKTRSENARQRIFLENGKPQTTPYGVKPGGFKSFIIIALVNIWRTRLEADRNVEVQNGKTERHLSSGQRKNIDSSSWNLLLPRE